MSDKPEIYERMAKIMAEIEPVTKARRNQQQGYQFRGIDDMYNAVQPIMARHGVFCTPCAGDPTVTERKTAKGGTLFYVSLKSKFTFYAPDGSHVECVTLGEAMDSGDKATNKAMSAAYKYALMQVFCIPTEEPKDSENDTHTDIQPRQQAAPPPPPAAKPPAPPPPMPTDLDPGDMLSDVDCFSAELMSAFAEKGFPIELADGIIAGILKAKGLPSLEYLSLGQRRGFIASINGGQFDDRKTKHKEAA